MDPNNYAFPQTLINNEGRIDSAGEYGLGGMTLRTWMATTLAAGMRANSSRNESVFELARRAVICADALIEELNKPKS